MLPPGSLNQNSVLPLSLNQNLNQSQNQNQNQNINSNPNLMPMPLQIPNPMQGIQINQSPLPNLSQISVPMPNDSMDHKNLQDFKSVIFHFNFSILFCINYTEKKNFWFFKPSLLILIEWTQKKVSTSCTSKNECSKLTKFNQFKSQY